MNSVHAYLFGRETIQIHASEQVINLLPKDFEQYRCEISASDKLSAELSVDGCLMEGKSIHGWSCVQNGLKHCASYCEKNAPIFQLEYTSGEYAKVQLHVNDLFPKGVSLGTQYGVMLALSGECIGLHSVTVICGHKAIVLSAPSGTGKTTLAKLLQKHCQAAIVNGDFALLSPDKEYGVLFEPTPFCGTSRTCHNYCLPISHIVFLEQAKETCISKMSAKEALKHMLSNTFVPEWDGMLRQSVESTALGIVEQVPVIRFSFPPAKEAAEKLFAFISS